MDERIIPEELEPDVQGLTRRELLKRAAVAGAGVTALGMLEIEPALGAGRDKVRWISPRGTLAPPPGPSREEINARNHFGRRTRYTPANARG